MPHVNGFRANTVGVGNTVGKKGPTPEELRGRERFVKLVKELVAEYAAARSDKKTPAAKEYGAQTKAAEQLGITQGHLSKILSGDRKASAKTIRYAAKSLKIREEYFYAPAEPVSYHDYVGRGKEPLFRDWKDFVSKKHEPPLKTWEREALAATAVPEGWEPKKGFYDGQLFLLRNLLTRAELDRGMERMQEIGDEFQRNRQNEPNHPEGG